MTTLDCTIWADRFSDRKVGHPNQPAAQTNLGTMIGDSSMKTIQLSKGQVAMVDDSDYEYLSKTNWFAMKGEYTCYAGGWTPMVKWQRKHLLMHRVIMKATRGQIVDHKDGNGLNNQKNNLRFCTASQNGQNQQVSKHPSKHSQYKGVTWHKGRRRKRRWQAVIRTKEKRDCYLGSFMAEIEAAKTYNKAATKHFGEFARLNDV